MMLWKEAQRRYGTHPDVVWPHARIESYFMSASENEYYRLIDKATAAWPYFTVERELNLCPRIKL